MTADRTRRLVTFARTLFHGTHGQDLVEYGLLVSIASTVIIIALSNINTSVTDYYGAAVQEIASRTAAAGTLPVGGGGQNGGGNGGNNGGGSGDSGGRSGDTG